MKKALLCAAIALCLVTGAAAQVYLSAPVYQMSYFSNINLVADQYTRVVNPGTLGTPLTGMHVAPPAGYAIEGGMCANMYVFDAFQEMEECCSCPITANGLLSFSLATNLLQNPLTGTPLPTNGVIKIVATPLVSGTFGGPLLCGQETVLPTAIDSTRVGLLAWQTHAQLANGGASVVLTETPFSSATLSSTGDPNTGELDFLSQACSFVQFLGSGAGVCTCPPIS